jgi:hypothetical protein
MAFYKWALDEIGGFDPIFRKAGDDVDVCWRLQESGRRIGFSAAGFVWHYRRSTVRAYLKQQSGYGEAEALLARKHPEYFNWLGGGMWRGRIYSSSKYGILLQRPVIYTAYSARVFQNLRAGPAYTDAFTSLEYHALGTLPVLLPLAVVSLVIAGRPPAWWCHLGSASAAGQADLPEKHRRWWSRPLCTSFSCSPSRLGAVSVAVDLRPRPRPAEWSALPPAEARETWPTGHPHGRSIQVWTNFWPRAAGCGSPGTPGWTT